MQFKYVFPCIVLLILIAGCSEPQTKVSSFDNSISVDFMLIDGHRPAYTITLAETTVLDTSTLGVVLDGVDLSRNMNLVSVNKTTDVEEEYSMQHGKQAHITYKAREKVYHLEHTSGRKMNVIFQVSDESVAFRYSFPGQDEDVHRISEEKTTFNFPDDSHAWLEPLANVNTGFAQTNPSYEEHYYIDVEVGTDAPYEAGWAYPALFKTDDTWLLISETGVDGTYSATRLQADSPGGEYQVGFPQETEQFPGGALYPESELPWKSPWRIIAIGDLETIVESTLGTDLADPAVEMDTSWIEPGRAAWSWAKLKDESVNYDTQKQFIDYASEMGWEYNLTDVNWDNNIGYDRIEELADYAASKDVGLILWYNSSGSWNETVYSPKSKLLTHEDRVAEFSRLQEMGIKGIKVDFFAGDGQSMIQYYLDIFKDAADHQILVNTHGATLPRGWHRTWPNLMTMESVKGFEFITFFQENADKAAEHGTMLPFTRNVYSPMDFTPMSLTELFNVKRQTTSAYELATPILFTSGIQHYAETPEGMAEIPEYVVEFVKKIPVAWDETEFIDGHPGEFVVMARRKGDQWFIAGINGKNEEREFSLDLSFIPEGSAGELIFDGENRFSFNHKNITLEGSRVLEVEMKGNGGFAMILQEQTN